MANLILCHLAKLSKCGIADGLLQIFYTGKSIFSSSASQEDAVAWKSNLGFAYTRRAMGGYRIDN